MLDALLIRFFRALKPKRKAQGLLLVSSGGIGDTILFSAAAPAFVALAKPGESVTIITQKASASVGFLLPDGITHHALDYRKFQRHWFYRARMGWFLYGLDVRLAIATDHLRHPLADDAFIFYSQAPERVALSPKSWPKYDAQLSRNLALYTQIIPMDPAPMHRYVRWLHIPAALTHQPLTIPVIDRNFAPVALALPRVVIHPFASTRARQPSVAWFAQLIEAIPESYEIVISAAPSDLAKNPDFRALTALPRVSLDTSSFAEKAAWIKGAALVISVDTSFFHLAAISGVPTLCLASAAHIIDSIPYDVRMGAKNVTYIVTPMDCAGCLGLCIHPLIEDRVACVDRIKVSAVQPKVIEILA